MLEDDRVYCEFIPDLVHLHPAIVSIILRAKGKDRAIAVTDSTEASGLNDGIYDLSLGRIRVSDGRAIREDGAIAGSAITLDVCIKNLDGRGFSLPDIFRFPKIPFPDQGSKDGLLSTRYLQGSSAQSSRALRAEKQRKDS